MAFAACGIGDSTSQWQILNSVKGQDENAGGKGGREPSDQLLQNSSHDLNLFAETPDVKLATMAVN